MAEHPRIAAHARYFVRIRRRDEFNALAVTMDRTSVALSSPEVLYEPNQPMYCFRARSISGVMTDEFTKMNAVLGVHRMTWQEIEAAWLAEQPCGVAAAHPLCASRLQKPETPHDSSFLPIH